MKLKLWAFTLIEPLAVTAAISNLAALLLPLLLKAKAQAHPIAYVNRNNATRFFPAGERSTL
jgi:competence protein ComGC